MDELTVPLDHPRFRSVDATIFTRQFAADCMTHSCTVVATATQRFDVCCQYGCDVDLHERDEILTRAEAIRAVLRPEVKHLPWFELDEEVDADYPSGRVVRSELHDGACVFLAHDQRGCGIHRTAIEQGWALRDVKPAICRLFPLSYEADAIVIADEYTDYSCAHVDGPTLYRLSRDTLGDVFGADLVTALDAAEARFLAAAPRRLPLAR
jgi:Fe-S-cluster containining protein